MAAKSVSIGVDLGGTKIAAGVVSDAGKILASSFVPTDTKPGYTPVVHQVAELIKSVAQQAGVALDQAHSVGVGLAGQVEIGTGLVHHAPTLFPERDIPFGPLLSERLGLPVVIDNDVRASTVGEYLFGFTQKLDSIYNIFVGTDIGSGYIAAGRILRGSTNSACDLGHHSIDFDGLECECGNRGCLDLYASGLAVARLAREAMERHPESLLWEVTGRDPAKADGHAVARAAEREDPAAREIVEQTGRWLGVGLANVINLFNPDVLMLGGGILKLGDDYRLAAESVARERALKAAVARTRFAVSQLGDDAGLIGASCLWRIDGDGLILPAA